MAPSVLTLVLSGGAGPEQELGCKPAGSRRWLKAVGRNGCWGPQGMLGRAGLGQGKAPPHPCPRPHFLGPKRMEVGLCYGKDQEKARNPARTSKREIPLNNFFPFSFSSYLFKLLVLKKFF